MAKELRQVCVRCVCGHQAVTEAGELQRRLGEPATFRNIARLWGRFRCGRCRAREKVALFDGDFLLIGSNDIRNCEGADCGLPILRPRLVAVPGTKLCVSCASEGTKPLRAEDYPAPPDAHSQCPRSGHPTVVRENSRTGHRFIGCTGFPKCRWTMPLTARLPVPPVASPHQLGPLD